MNQSLFPSLICALFAAVLFGVARSIDEGTFQNVLVVGGIILVVYSGFYALGYLLVHLPGIIFAIGDLGERLIHPEIALVTAMGNLDQDQLSAYLQESGKLILFVSDGKADWAIRSKGRELSSDWISAYLYKCENNIPSSELPAVSSHAPKSQIYADETAMIAHLRGMEFCQFRPGQNDEWIDGHSPETARKEYFREEYFD